MTVSELAGYFDHTLLKAYAAPEDFAFVRDFILARCPRAVVSGHTGGRDT